MGPTDPGKAQWVSLNPVDSIIGLIELIEYRMGPVDLRECQVGLTDP
jgi:hypothetical protein